MRVLAIGSMYPPHHFGGYELVWQGAMRRARDAGHEVRIVTSDHRVQGRGEEEADVHRELRWHWSWERDEWVSLGAAGRLSLELHNAACLRRHLREFAPDVVTWWPMGGMSLSLVERVWRRGLPSVLAVHDDWLVYGPKRDAWMRIWQGRGLRALVGAALDPIGLPTRFHVERWGRFLFNSNYTLERARSHGVAARDVAVVSPGIEDWFLAETPARPWEWRLAYVGRVDQVKGVDVAVAALAELPDASLRVVGDGHPAYLERLRAIAARSGSADRLELAPAVGAERLPAVYAAADAIVFPVRWREPWGLVPLEAMAIGRPVVATARGGPEEFLRDGDNCLIVPPDDPRAIAGAVKRLAGDAELRSRLVEGGRVTARRHRARDFEDRIVAELEAAGRN